MSARPDRAQAGAMMRRAATASVVVAAVLIAAKVGAWLATDSVAVLSSLLDSLLDAAASLVNLVAVRHALSEKGCLERNWAAWQRWGGPRARGRRRAIGSG